MSETQSPSSQTWRPSVSAARWLAFAGGLIAVLAWHPSAYAQQTVCAKVQLEIRQEIALARQAFEARLGITNSLPSNLTNVRVVLKFADENGNPVAGSSTTAIDPAVYFFAKQEISAGGTASAPHPPTVAAGTEVTLIWTMIPTLTAANVAGAGANGVIYQIGAQLLYTTGGKDEIVNINPDFIRVKPLPEIQLDYFLPGPVSGDDPLTPIPEPPVPFSLALRARNLGLGTARSLTIESSAPKILRNDQDAPVKFTINSVRLNDAPVRTDLIVSGGDLSSGSSAMVRWEMRSKLSGVFSSFTAELSHSDELGGALTALLRDPATHRLEGEVLVDLPGRDHVVDILAWESASGSNSPLRVYESRNVDPTVTADLSDMVVPVANIQLAAPVVSNAGAYVVSLGAPSPVGGAFAYVRGVDPLSGNRPIKRVVRSDGKVLLGQNAWLTRDYIQGNPPSTAFRLHIFDALPVGIGAVSWRVEFDNAAINHAPVLGALANRIVRHGQPVAFNVTASDPDGQIVALGLATRPYGSEFTVGNDGTGSFAWTPGATEGIPQKGDFPMNFVASDGLLSTQRTVVLTVTDALLIDSWKARWWPPGDSASANGADPDGDGLSNLYEYALDLDPTRSSTAQRPVLTRESINGKHYLALTALYRTDDPSLIVDTVASSAAGAPIEQWTSTAATSVIDTTNTPPGFTHVRFTDSVALEDSSTGRFVRLRVRIQ